MAECQRVGVEDVDVIVEFLLLGDPIFEAFRDRVFRVGELDRNRLLRAVSAGLQTEVLEPKIISLAEGMHRAMQMHRRNRFVSLENILQDFRVLIRSGTFVVDNNVVSLGPIGVLVNRQRRIGRAIPGPDNIDPHIGTLLNPLVEDLVLLDVVVATATGDEEGFEWAGTVFGGFLFRFQKEGGQGQGKNERR